MNQNGRVIGSVMIGIALLWLSLRIAGASPFANTANNQVGTPQAAAQTPPDRPPIQNFDATRPGTGTQNFDTPGNSAGTGDQNTVAQNPGTSGTGTSGTTTTQRQTPAVRGAW